MTSKGKKNKLAGKMSKKTGTAPKKRSKAKINEDVCFYDSGVLTEELTCCEYECCCLL